MVELATIVLLTKNSYQPFTPPPEAVNKTSPPSQAVSFGASEESIPAGIGSTLKKMLLLVLPQPLVK